MIQGNSQNLPRRHQRFRNQKNNSQPLNRSKPQLPEVEQLKYSLLEYNDLRKSFLIFSKIHQLCNLRHQTMFLAFEIYSRTVLNDRFKFHMDRELQCVCIFLAMKYEEIYPPSLKVLAETMDWDFPLNKYIMIEEKVIEAMGGNLGIPTMNQSLKVCLGHIDNQLEMLGMLLLEISIATRQIFSRFPKEKIIEAIVVILRESSQDPVCPTLLMLIRLILQARVQSDKKLPRIYKKYLDKRYHSVSDLSLTNKRKDNDFT